VGTYSRDRTAKANRECCGSGMFYLGSEFDLVLIPDPDPNIFYPGSYMKVECKLTQYRYFFLAFYAFRSKVLVLVIVIVKKIRDP
jgi:hypothetical protein